MDEHQQALKYISEIIDRGVKDYPGKNFFPKSTPLELAIGAVTEGMEVRSVGNSLTLHETALVEACNLKFAIEYRRKNCKFI